MTSTQCFRISASLPIENLANLLGIHPKVNNEDTVLVLKTNLLTSAEVHDTRVHEVEVNLESSLGDLSSRTFAS